MAATTRQLRRLRRRLIAAGVLVAAFAALAAPAAQAYPTGLNPSQTRVAGTGTIVRRVIVSSPSRFSWNDAAIGAALATITVVLLGGAIQTTRTRRHLPTQQA
jgi:hypothetical protein